MIFRKTLNVVIAYLMTALFYLGIILAFTIGCVILYLMVTSGLENKDKIFGVIDVAICKGFVIVSILAQLPFIVIRFRRAAREAGPTGVFLTPSNFPALYALIHRVATDLRVPAPDEVYIQPVPAAASYEFPTRLSSKRVLMLGWPLVLLLSQAELKSVVAHELAHFDYDAFILHRALWHVEGAMKKTSEMIDSYQFVDDSYGGLVKMPVTIYLALFTLLYMPATRFIRHRFELYCDRKSASHYGANVFGSALGKTSVLWLSLGDYLRREGVDKKSPRFFDRYFNHHLQLLQEGKLDKAIIQIADMGDNTHPSLAKRLEVVAHLPTKYDNNQTIEVKYSEKSDIEDQLASFL